MKELSLVLWLLLWPVASALNVLIFAKVRDMHGLDKYTEHEIASGSKFYMAVYGVVAIYLVF